MTNSIKTGEIIFYSYIDCYRLLTLYNCKRANLEIYYFEISGPAKKLIYLLGLNDYIKSLDFNLSEVRDERGELFYIPIVSKYMLDICTKIEKDILQHNHFISKICTVFDRKRIMLFLKKINNIRLLKPVTQMVIASWHMRNKVKHGETGTRFYIENNYCYAVLRKFAQVECNLEANEYYSMRSVYHGLKRSFGRFYYVLKLMVEPFFNGAVFKKMSGTDIKDAKVASLYSGWNLTLNRQQRSDLPWLLMSNIPHDRVLVFFERSDIPATDATISEVHQSGVSLISLTDKASKSKTIPVYAPSIYVSVKLFQLTWRVLFALFSSIRRGELRSFALLEQTLHFIREYVKAMDFYTTNSIKIVVDRFDLEPNRIPRQLALKELDGISITYQLSHWAFPITHSASFADIYFIFGNYYRQGLIKSGTINKNIVSVGYINDYSFAATKEKSALLRKRLIDNGATFVLCYFDENSSGDKMSIIANDTAASIYRKLLQYVLSEPNIGLIFSPKCPYNLNNRMPMLNSLIDKALETGRCVFMDSDRYTKSYPNEAAQASDISIALLYSGTAGMESYLAGTRVLFIDLEGCYSYPEYEFGKNKTIFEDMDSLLREVKRIAGDRTAFNEFKNDYAFHNIMERDPFRDNKASFRIGQYIECLLEKIDMGETRQAAIAYANKRYGQAWGEQYIMTSPRAPLELK